MVGVCAVGSLDIADRAIPSGRQVPGCFRPPSEKIIQRKWKAKARGFGS